MGNKLILSFFLIFQSYCLFSQKNLLTVAERSDFKTTANHMEVIHFIDQLAESSEFIRIDTLAVSTEGRSIPLLIIGNPLPLSPEQMKDDNRIVIYIQANIHAGEVEGKEASLMFARDFLAGKNRDILKNVVILICPNLNPDGNEQISPLNRTHQTGPDNGVGVRHNAQFLDLNRDGMKAESREIRGVITNVFNKWDPAVFMDCHTTNGSYHVEPVTFTWMVNPNGDNSLIKYMHSKMMPEIAAALRNKYKVENCFYGEFIDMMKPETGWLYEAPDPRYMTNYYGLRNRLGILNENYVYADYESRVRGCYYLIWSLTEYSASHRSEIKEMLKKTDEKTVFRGKNPAVTDSFAVEYKVRPLPEKVTVMTYEAEPAPESDVWPPYRKTDRQKTVTVPYLIDYYPSKNVKFPFAYLLTVNDREVIDLLKLQGIKIEKLTVESNLDVERFEISELKGATRLNQGHYTNTIDGKFIKTSVSFPSGTLIIKTAQPLANLAAYLLEPQSNDGLLTWNFLDRYLVPQWGTGYNPYPVYKLLSPVELKTLPVN